MTTSTSIRHLRSIATHISNLEKDNAALRERIKHLEGICQSLAQHIEHESEASRWDDFEVSDEESVASNSESESESESELESTTVEESK